MNNSLRQRAVIAWYLGLGWCTAGVAQEPLPRSTEVPKFTEISPEVAEILMSEAGRVIFSRGIVPVQDDRAPPEDASSRNDEMPTRSMTQANVIPAPAPTTSTVWTLKSDPNPQRTLAIAANAWAYFEKNYQVRTGWIDSVAGYPSATLWDIASGFAGIACALQLGLTTREKGQRMLSQAIKTLADMNLYNGEMPNRAYHTGTALLDGPQSASGKGSGWSALDIGRLLTWLRLISTWYPEHASAIAAVVSSWKFDRVVRDGALYGALYNGTREYLRQEGRLGYEQYAAQGYKLWGFSLARASGYGSTAPFNAGPIELLADQRNVPFLTSEPFLLAAFEFGALDETFNRLTTGLYQAQQQRWRDTGILTAATEDSINQAPWFVYYNVSYQGKAWHCVDHTGKPAADLCGLSTKAAFGWATLFDDDYAKRLTEAAIPLHASKGYWAGRYENGTSNAVLNVNTNAVILEAMLFRQRGRRSFALDIR